MSTTCLVVVAGLLWFELEISAHFPLLGGLVRGSLQKQIMETLLEQQRRYHEERERLMDAMSKESLHPTKTVNCRPNSDCRPNSFLTIPVDIGDQKGF